MNDEILIHFREIYGKWTAYPANTQAELIARIAGTKTLSFATLELAEDMGFRLVRLDPMTGDRCDLRTAPAHWAGENRRIAR